MGIIILLLAIGFVDLAGRIAALIQLMKNGNVKRLSYKTWVLLCIFVNFAWFFYFILGRGNKNV